MSLRRVHGFTLLELMVTVAVLAILAGIAYPGFQATLRSNRVAAANNEVVGLVNLARSEAIRSGRGGGLCGSSDGAACDGTWSSGMLAFADTDADGTQGATEIALRFVTLGPRLQVAGPPDEIAFDGRGRRRASSNQQITLRPETCSRNAPQRRVLTVNASGQVRSLKGPCE